MHPRKDQDALTTVGVASCKRTVRAKTGLQLGYGTGARSDLFKKQPESSKKGLIRAPSIVSIYKSLQNLFAKSRKARVKSRARWKRIRPHRKRACCVRRKDGGTKGLRRIGEEIGTRPDFKGCRWHIGWRLSHPITPLALWCMTWYCMDPAYCEGAEVWREREPICSRSHKNIIISHNPYGPLYIIFPLAAPFLQAFLYLYHYTFSRPIFIWFRSSWTRLFEIVEMGENHAQL
jgi:hypothetical protein